MPDLKCAKCPQIFSTVSNKLKHERNMHSREKETQLKKLFKKSSTRSHGCSICGRFFSTNSNMNRHKNAAHSETVKRFDCSKCTKTYSTQGNLKLHLVSYHVHRKKKADRTGEYFDMV